jgi:transcriptional regulator with XRE-family HTH domain
MNFDLQTAVRRVMHEKSQAQLSALTGLSRPYVSQLLSKRRDASLSTVAKIASAAHMKLSDFIRLGEPEA